MKEFVCKFFLYPNRHDYVMFIGESYFKYWEVNYTNQTMKENKWSDIPMRLEKESTFVDAEFIKGIDSNIFVLITSCNHIFIYKDEKLIHLLENHWIEQNPNL